jgi:hypothetical protein
MRKLLTLVLALASFGFMGSWSETKGNAVTKANPQVQIRIGRRRHNDRDRDRYRREYRENNYGMWNTTETRIVHDGWRTYRDTYQVRHFADGRTQWILISRDRVY